MKLRELLKTVVTPRLRGALLVRLASGTGLSTYFWRNVVMTLHGCDISANQKIPADIHLPHPNGIVIGEGVIIGRDVTIYHNVTLGRNGKGDYPEIQDGACLMPGVTVIGDVVIGAKAIVGAHCLVTRDVPAAYIADGEHHLSMRPRKRLSGWPNA